MFAFYTALLLPLVAADNGYLWSSVAFVRAGDSTPSVGNKLTTLTPLGAEQLFSVGSFFRSRYIDGHGLAGLDRDTADDSQVVALALDEQYTAASGQAFMQGLYPPSNATSGVANGTPVSGPLGGMSFARISTTGQDDSNMIYVGGNRNCPALEQYSEDGINIESFTEIEQTSQPIYNSVSALLDGVISAEKQTYYNAWEVYDYLNYLHTYNSTAAAELDRLNVMTQLRVLADSQQSAYLGNLKASNPLGKKPEAASIGGISTIAGASTAKMILDALTASAQRSQDSYQLSLIFGDFDPMMSLFALLGLPAQSADFSGLPSVGSALVFELYSTAPTATGIMPSTSDLFVRFGFRNGTNASTTLTAFPIFGRSAGSSDMSYSEFVQSMNTIAIAGAEDWCQQCGSEAAFCAAQKTSSSRSSDVPNPDDDNAKDKNPVSTVVAGVLGAIIGLLAACIIAAAILLLTGLRLSRKKSSVPIGFVVSGRQPHQRSNSANSANSVSSTRRYNTTATTTNRPHSPAASINSEKSWGCADAPARPSDRLARSRSAGSTRSTGSTNSEEAMFRNMIHEPRRVVRRAEAGSIGNVRFPVRRADANVDRHGRCYPVGSWSNYSE